MMETMAEALTGTALCWGCVPGTGLPELIGLAARHGFGEISAQPGQYFRARDDGADPAALLAAAGVKVGVVDALLSQLPGAPDPADVPRGLRADYAMGLDRCLEAAQALGARALNVAHYLGSPADPGEMAAAVREAAEAAAGVGVAVVLEFIPGTGIPDLATALDLARRVDLPNAGVLFDTWHFLRCGGAVGEIARLAEAPVVEVQISGRRTPAPGEPYVPMKGRLAPGEGDAPLAEIVRAVRAAVPGAVLSLEVFPDSVGDPDAAVGRLASATAEFLETVG